MPDKAQVNFRFKDRDIAQKETFRYNNELQVVARPVDLPSYVPQVENKYDKFLKAFSSISSAARDFLQMQKVMAQENEVLGRIGAPRPKEFLNLGLGYNRGVSMSAGESAGAEMAIEYSGELLKNNYFADDAQGKEKRLALFKQISEKHLQGSQDPAFLEAAGGHMIKARLSGEATAMEKQMELLEINQMNNTYRGINAFLVELGEAGITADAELAREQVNALYMIHGKANGLSRETFNSMLFDSFEQYADEQGNDAAGIVKATNILNVLRLPDKSGVRIENLTDKSGKPIYRDKINAIHGRLLSAYGKLQEKKEKANEKVQAYNESLIYGRFKTYTSEEQCYEDVMKSVEKGLINPKAVDNLINSYRSFKSSAGTPDNNVVAWYDTKFLSGELPPIKILQKAISSQTPATQAAVLNRYRQRMDRLETLARMDADRATRAEGNDLRKAELNIKIQEQSEKKADKVYSDKAEEVVTQVAAGRKFGSNVEPYVKLQTKNFIEANSTWTEDGGIIPPSDAEIANHVSGLVVETDLGEGPILLMPYDPNTTVDPSLSYSTTANGVFKAQQRKKLQDDHIKKQREKEALEARKARLEATVPDEALQHQKEGKQ